MLLPLASEAFTQNSYRWRSDNGLETSATFTAAENTPFASASIGVNQRVRLGATNSGTEGELLRQAAVVGTIGEDNYWTSVIDTTAGFIYAGTNNNPGRITKIRTSDFTKVASIDLAPGEEALRTSVIDTVNGFAYFGAGSFSGVTEPAKIIKVRLSDFTRVDTLTIPEFDLRSAVIDVAAGFAYFGTGQSPAKIIKINLATFTQMTTLTPGENGFFSAVIDTNGATHFAYFGTNTSQIVKINLTTFLKDSTLVTAGTGESNYSAATIDTIGATHFAYFGSSTGRIVKINLTSFTNVGPTISLPAGEDSLAAAAIDTAAGFAYFAGGIFSSPARLIKIDLGTFTRSNGLQLPVNHMSAESLVIDPSANTLYLSLLGAPAKMAKFDLTTFSYVTSLATVGGDFSFISAVIDRAAGFAYFGTGTNPGRIAKARLSDMTIVADLQLVLGEGTLRSAAIDTAAGFAYFATDMVPGYIIKVDLATFTKVGSIAMPAGEDSFRTLNIDTSGGFLYAASNTTPAKVAKISLATFTEVGSALSLTINLGRSAVIDPAAGFLYVASSVNPAGLAKIQLSTFTQIGAAITLTGLNGATTAEIDASGATHFAYFGSNDSPGKVAKVDLSTFLMVGTALTLNSGDNQLQDAIIDTVNGFLYFSTNVNPAIIIKVRLSDFTRFSALTLTAGEAASEAFMRSAVIDVPNGLAYFGTNSFPGRIIKVSLAPKAQFRLEYGLKTSTCAAIGSWTQVPTTAGPTDAWQMADSGFFVDGAASTNNAGLTDGNTSFNPGIIKDTSSQTSEISLGEKQFTELEYSVRPVNDATIGSTYCFRLTNAGSTTGFTFSQYAEATVSPRPPAGSGGCSFVIRPNGAEHLTAGQSYDIQWSHSSCQSQKARISLSTDGGGTYPTLIADNEPEDGSYTWTVPNITTTTAKVRVELLAGGAIQGSDASDGDFSITGTPGTPSIPPPTIPPPPSTTTPYDPTAEQAKATTIDEDQGWQPTEGPHPCIQGTALKSVSSKAVYYCGSDGKKHIFPNEKTYKTWFEDFSHVMTFSDETVASIPEGKTITYKPGVKMVKLPTDAKTYAVAAGGVLRWVTTESKAAQLYGANWNTKIDDLTESTFDDYSMGQPIQ